MNKKILTIFNYAFVISVLLGISACNKEENTNNNTETTLSGTISTNRTLTADKTYLIKGFVYVDNGATLTIEPGTVLKGDKDSKGSLIIKPGSKIMAEGTALKPIIFTSNQPKGSRNYGDWGGLIVLGNAPVNKNPAVIEGENISTYGGSNPDDNSGIIKYVRIEFAGIAFETDKEINGLTLAGVGRGTQIEYVQVSYIGDDAFEWFGGTVNVKHIIAYRALDDDFDTDNGFSGFVQYGIGFRDPNIADQSASSSSNGFESDNDGSGSNATPQTSASFANFSVIIASGSVNAKYNDGILIRRNSAISFYNTLIIGAYPKSGIEFNGSASQTNYINGTSIIKGVALVGMTKSLLTTDTATFNSNQNHTNWNISDLMLNVNYNNLSSPSWLPQATSPLLSNGVTLPSGFENNTYIGAFNTLNWTEGWTNFDPQNTDY